MRALKLTLSYVLFLLISYVSQFARRKRLYKFTVYKFVIHGLFAFKDIL